MQQQLQQQCRAGFGRQQQRQVRLLVAVDVVSGSLSTEITDMYLARPCMAVDCLADGCKQQSTCATQVSMFIMVEHALCRQQFELFGALTSLWQYSCSMQQHTSKIDIGCHCGVHYMHMCLAVQPVAAGVASLYASQLSCVFAPIQKLRIACITVGSSIQKASSHTGTSSLGVFKHLSCCSCCW
jgi:hypothetical protein